MAPYLLKYVNQFLECSVIIAIIQQGGVGEKASGSIKRTQARSQKK